MAEQTFKSPGFFEREIDLSQRETEIVGVPAGVAGTAQLGPAFVPVTIGSFADFERRFGTLDTKMFGPYAVREFLRYRTSLTYVRVLGAGSNDSSTDITLTRNAGVVKSAGFKIIPTLRTTVSGARQYGSVKFIAAAHFVSASNASGSPVDGYPVFSDNDSFAASGGDKHINLVRGMLFTTTGSTMEIMDYTSSYDRVQSIFEAAGGRGASTGSRPSDVAIASTAGLFKIIVSSSAAAAYKSDDNSPGIRVYTASLDPSSDSYIAKILNTDPERFQQDQHLLYAHFPVEAEIAKVATGQLAYASGSVALLSGSALSSTTSGILGQSFQNAFGRFDTRYSPARSTSFISQPYGKQEYDLFHMETISDGQVVNDKFKISISNIRKSTNPRSPYGTFTVQVRAFEDTDTNIQILEQYPNCTLNPNDDDFVAKKIGDFKTYYNFDAEQEDERKMLVDGRYPNISSRIRVIMSEPFLNGDIPLDALPFGFRGLPVLKTSDTLTDGSTRPLVGTYSSPGAAAARRLTMTNTLSRKLGASHAVHRLEALSGSIVPPIPMTFKVTRGNISTSQAFVGDPGENERVDARYYWGTKFTRVAPTGSLANSVLNPNASSEINDLIRNYSKVLGIAKLDNLVTGSGADEFNNNKFSLSRVALFTQIANNSSGNPDLSTTANTLLTGSAKEQMLETAYIRNAKPDSSNYTITDGGVTGRLTFASLLSLTSSIYFNRFSEYAKFTNSMYGGFDGINILDKDMARMNDRSTSQDTGGKAASGIPSAPGAMDIGLSVENNFGAGRTNNIVASYRTAGKILTDPTVSRINILAIPGIRDSGLTDYIFDLLKDYGKAIYLIDVPSYDGDTNRIFDGGGAPSVDKTQEQFAGRSVDSNYSAAYFPDVSIQDDINNQPVAVPASVAAISALAFNDSISYPWFAPAGFNRGALDNVVNVRARLNQKDRDDLYESRINPIATFPQAGFVIFGQKTLQLAKSSLDRVNVRRMLLEVKRIVSDIANRIVFEQNTPETRARFVSQVTPLLSNVQSQQGIDQFKVVMDSSNNSQLDIENNVLNGRIVVVPTRAVEFISIDFIITNAGVSFE
jgi:hypothetical protein